MNTWMMFPMIATTKRGVGVPGLVCRLYNRCAVQVCHNHDTAVLVYHGILYYLPDNSPDHFQMEESKNKVIALALDRRGDCRKNPPY